MVLRYFEGTCIVLFLFMVFYVCVYLCFWMFVKHFSLRRRLGYFFLKNSYQTFFTKKARNPFCVAGNYSNTICWRSIISRIYFSSSFVMVQFIFDNLLAFVCLWSYLKCLYIYMYIKRERKGGGGRRGFFLLNNVK